MLDVGCGAGANALILSGRGHEVHGITLSQAEAEIVAPFVNRFTFLTSTVRCLHFGTSSMLCCSLTYWNTSQTQPMC